MSYNYILNLIYNRRLWLTSPERSGAPLLFRGRLLFSGKDANSVRINYGGEIHWGYAAIRIEKLLGITKRYIICDNGFDNKTSSCNR